MGVTGAPGGRALPFIAFSTRPAIAARSATASLAVEEPEARVRLAAVAELAVPPPVAEVPGTAESLALASVAVRLMQTV